MNCKLKERERYIAEYVDGTLRQEDLTRFEEHYFQCRQCFMEVEAVVDAASIIAAEGKKLTARPPQQNKAFLNISGLFTAGSGVKWGIAFTAAALIIFIILNDNNISTENSFTEKETYSDPVITDKESEQTADSDIAAMRGPSFEPSHYMEEWITETQRSSGTGIKIISPAPGNIFNDEDISFSWQTPAESVLYLKILDNMEDEIFSAQITAGNKNVQAEKNIFPGSGLYYWRIENEEEVIYTGKFYFLKTDK